MSILTNSLGELAGIEAVVAQISSAVTHTSLNDTEITVFSDSQYALKALKRLGQDSGQFLVGSIALISHGINSSASNVKIGFQWCPAHSNVPGNEKAHKLAKSATEKGREIQHSLRPFPIARAIVSQKAKSVKVIEDITSLSRSKTGRFVKSIDKKIPDSHTSLLYNGKSKPHAGLLCQLRTGICRLNSYLSKIHAVESAECGCNTGKETVHHFLFCCPLWERARSRMKQLADRHNRWGDTSFLLGGWSGPGKDGDFNKWKPDLAMVAATINFAATTGRLDQETTSDEGERGGD